MVELNGSMLNKDLEIENLNYLVERYDFKNNSNLLIGIDKLETGMDLVVYDVEEMLEVPTDIDNFYDIITENGLDEEEFEIDRVTFIRVD